MAMLSGFNPHEMKADTVRKVATGRDEPLARLLEIIRRNLTAPTKQHVIVSAPRGYGKSFLLRYVQVKIEEIAKDEGLPIAMALLPEELPHVKEPDTLLAEIRRTFLNESADTIGARWAEDDGEAWYQGVAELDTAIGERLGSGGLLIAGVENFDLLVRKAFAKDVQGGILREFLTRKGNRIMLLAASARGAFDRDYNRPLFKAFEEVALERWTVEECITFFRAQRAAAGKQPLTEVQEAKARAVANFIGGTPRLATLIGEALLEDDPVRAADLLDKLVDELTPYYKERIEVLPARSQALLDGLLRGGEKCSATDLARRVGAPSQAAIAAPLHELRKDLIVIGEKAPDSAEVLLRVTDRVFAHYYRKRILSHGQDICPLEALVDLLAVFYSPEEKRREAEKLKARGLAREAAVMERLWQAEQARGGAVLRPRPELGRDATFEKRMEEWDRVTEEGRFEEGLLILNEAISDARAIKDIVAESEVLCQRTWTLNELRRYDESLACAREATALAERGGDPSAEAFANSRTADCLICLRRYDEALASAGKAVALAEVAGHVEMQARSGRQKSYSLNELGRYDEALAASREAAAMAEQIGDDFLLAVILRNAAFSLSQLERYDEALSTAQKAAALAERAGDIGEQAVALSGVASSLSQLGRNEEAVTTAREAAALAERGGDVFQQALALRCASVSLGHLRRYDEAIATAREAIALAEQAGDIDEQAIGLSNAAHYLRLFGRKEEAIRTIHQAVAAAGGVREIYTQRILAYSVLPFRTLIEKDVALASYSCLMQPDEAGNYDDAALWFDDIAHVVTSASAWPRLVAAVERSAKAAGQIVATANGLGEAGRVIAAIQAGNQPDAALAQARHLVAALAQAIETASDPAFARLWGAVLNASAEQVATQVEDAAFLRDFADIFTAYSSVSARAKGLIAAAADYHAGGRDPRALARLEPDLATTLMAVFPPRVEFVKRKRKPRVKRKR